MNKNKRNTFQRMKENKPSETPWQALDRMLSFQIGKNGPPILAIILTVLFLAAEALAVILAKDKTVQSRAILAIVLVYLIAFRLFVTERWKFDIDDEDDDT